MHRSRHCIDNILIHFTVLYLIILGTLIKQAPAWVEKQRQTTTEQKNMTNTDALSTIAFAGSHTR